MKERFPFGKGEKEMEMPCKGCGELGHSLEECPRLSKEEVERRLTEERLKQERMMESQIERGQGVEGNIIRGKEGEEGYKKNIEDISK